MECQRLKQLAVRHRLAFAVLGLTLVTLAGAPLFVQPASAKAWYNSSWGYRIEISVDHSKVGVDLTNFPIYLNLADMPASFFSNVKSDGGDIRLTSSDGSTELPIELVSINTSSKTGELYFKAASLSSSADTDFYIYYGNPSASAYAANATYGSQNVWTNGFQAVYHMQDGSAVDSTANGYNGTQSNTSDVAGELGQARSYTGALNSYISLPYQVLNGLGDITTTYWLKTSTTRSKATVSGARSTSDNNTYLLFVANTAVNVYFGTNKSYSTPAIADGTYHYAAFVSQASSGSVDVYNNGALSDSDTQSVPTTLTLSPGGLYLAQEQDSVGGGFSTSQSLIGDLDEVRFSSVPRSAGWISTTYQNQSSPATFYSLGTPLTSGNNPPIANNDSTSAGLNSATVIDVLANDTDPDGDSLSVQSVTTPANGSATINGNNTITYTPDIGFAGNDTFNYTISDPSGLTDTATVTVKVGSWYNSAWSYRLPITVDHTKISADLTDFPVYIDLADLPTSFFSNVRSDGADIRITKSNGVSEVPYELVSINKSTKTGELYFKAPALSSSADTTFYIYFGDPSATAYAANATYGSQNVWTNGYQFVSHDGGGTDSTANQYDGTSGGGITLGGASGKFGNGTSFDGNDDIINLPIGILNNLSDITASYWLKTSDTGQQALLSGAITTASNNYLDFLSNNNQLTDFRGTGSVAFSTSNMATDSFQNLAVVSDSGTGKVAAYQNGQLLGSQSIALGTTQIDANGLKLGQDQDSVDGGYDPAQALNGTLDEVRVSSVARTAAWIGAAYDNENSPTNFYVVGGAETPPGPLFSDIVDASGNSVGNPSFALTTVSPGFGCMSSTGSFGTSNERVRVSNTSSVPGWSLTMAATDGSGALWSDGSAVYDYNDPTGSPAGCSPGLDSDTYAGLLGIDFGDTLITPRPGCSNTGITLGPNANFDEGSVDALTLMTAGSSAGLNCYWDLTNVGLKQQIPYGQAPGNYSLNLTMTVVAD